MKHIISITGIRPDFIRMSKVFKKLDINFKHTLIHTGQHYSSSLSDVFFKDLDIRQPDYNWGVGQASIDHIEQLANLSKKIKENEDLIRSADLVLFLGDSNSALAAVPIKKMGVKVGHIEAGMRSGDRRMFEEINRTVCDHCSDFLFTYHSNYAEHLRKENIINGVHVVGNTILEVAKEIYDTKLSTREKQNSHILLDIHRPENFQDRRRLKRILTYASFYGRYYKLPVYILNFSRTMQAIKDFGIDLGKIQVKEQMGFVEYLNFAYDSRLTISDSGTAPEELPILKTPVLVPRDYTERPEAYEHGCAVYLSLHKFNTAAAEVLADRVDECTFDISWLGAGDTSSKIIKILKDNL